MGIRDNKNGNMQYQKKINKNKKKIKMKFAAIASQILPVF
jgi:hypothetical protein